MTNDLHQMAASYALDALDDAERVAFERHNESCETCDREVAEFGETAAILAEAVAAAPPSDLRSRVLAEVLVTRQAPPALDARLATSAGRQWRHRFALVAAAILVVVGIGVFSAERLGESEVDEFALLLEAEDAVVTALEGEAGTVQVVWSASRDQVAVLGSGLPTLTDDQVFELWFLPEDSDGSVERAGLFSSDDNGGVRHMWNVTDRQSVGWGVTIEPAGGSEQPTSEVLFAGSF